MTNPETPTHDAAELLEFLYRLGQSYLACGEQTAQVELQLRRVAGAYGARRSRIVAFPTAIFISIHHGEKEHVTLAEGPLRPLRLDQMADVYALGARAQQGEVSLAEGLQQLTSINRQPPRFGVLGTLVGHTLLTVGVALVLNQVFVNIAAAAVLGTVIGLIKVAVREKAPMSVPLPVIAAMLVSGLVFTAMRYGLEADPLHLLIPPLVTFLPGAMLTFGMIELAYGDMVSGAGRLITGFVQLALLVVGLAAGAAMVGVRLDDIPEVALHATISPFVPWVGVVAFCIGVFLHFSGPKRALPWILLVVLLAFAAQRFSAGVFGGQFSGFFGTLVATPLGYLIQLRFKGPPPMVTFLPSFWLMVPGAMSLISVKRILSDTAGGLEGLVSAVFVLVSIAIGTLLGASLYKFFSERFGSWQLQIGRKTTKNK